MGKGVDVGVGFQRESPKRGGGAADGWNKTLRDHIFNYTQKARTGSE